MRLNDIAAGMLIGMVIMLFLILYEQNELTSKYILLLILGIIGAIVNIYLGKKNDM